jgi:hypothetical protein
MKTARELAAFRGLTAAYALSVPPALLRGSATEEEVARKYPGADSGIRISAPCLVSLSLDPPFRAGVPSG